MNLVYLVSFGMSANLAARFANLSASCVVEPAIAGVDLVAGELFWISANLSALLANLSASAGSITLFVVAAVEPSTIPNLAALDSSCCLSLLSPSVFLPVVRTICVFLVVILFASKGQGIG